MFCIVTDNNELQFIETNCKVGSQRQVTTDVFYWTYGMCVGTDISSASFSLTLQVWKLSSSSVLRKKKKKKRKKRESISPLSNLRHGQLEMCVYTWRKAHLTIGLVVHFFPLVGIAFTCSTVPCDNGGICVNNGTTCECQAGFNGNFCQCEWGMPT